MSARNGRITVTRVYQEVSEVREHMARLRGELNGNLPRLIRQVDRLTELVEKSAATPGSTRNTKATQNEVERPGGSASQGDGKSNEDEHKRIYLRSA